MHTVRASLVVILVAIAVPATTAHYVPPAPGTPFEGTSEVCAGEAPGFTFCSTGNHVFALEVLHSASVIPHPGCHFVADNGCFNGVLISELAVVPQPAYSPLQQISLETCRVAHYAYVAGVQRDGFPHGAAHPEDHGYDVECVAADTTEPDVCETLRGLPVDPAVVRAPPCLGPTEANNLAGRPVNHFCESRNLRDPDQPGGFGIWFCEIRHL